MTIPVLTPDGFKLMKDSIEKECAGLDELRTGVSVVLWRLRELVKGYEYALEHGYTSQAYLVDERETNP